MNSELLDPVHRRHGLEARVTRDVWVAIAIGLVTFVVFSGVLSHAFLDAWDDNIAITDNPDFNPPSLSKLVHYWVPPPKDEFFVPVMYTLWGLVAIGARGASGVLHPGPFHALNLIAHSLAAAVAYLVLRRISVPRWAAAVAALVFALHPIQTEAVAWASSAYTPISGMLGLVAIWQFMKFTDARERGEGRRAAGHYAVALGAFVIAMLTKPAAVSVPLIAGAVEICVRRRALSRLVAPLGVWVLVSVPIVMATRHGTPGATVGQFEPWQKLVVGLDSVAFYIFKIMWPYGLSPDYGRSPTWVLGHPGVWAAGLVTVGVLICAWVVRKRVAWVGGAAAVFLLGLLPTLGLAPFNFQTFSTVADRYAYLSMFGVAIAIGIALSRVRVRLVPVLVSGLVVCGLAALSVRQMTHWRNNWTLFDYTLKVNPGSRIVGAQLRFMLNPAVEARCDLTPGEIVGMADVLMGQKRANLAEPLYRLAVERGETGSATWRKLAGACLANDQPVRAVDALDRALARDPGDAEAHAMKGDALIRSDPDRASAEYRTALEIDPGNARARRGMSVLGPDTRPAP